MFRISLSELEELRQDPAAYKRRRDTGGGFRPWKSVFQALRRAIYEYHKTPQDPHSAMSYLEGALEHIKTRALCERAVIDLEWYISEHRNRAWPTALHKHNISIPLSVRYADSVRVTGEVSRVDIHPGGGYAAWLLLKGDASDWLHELRMPIVQNGVAVDMGVDPMAVHVGVYGFETHAVHAHCFTLEDIRAAHVELEDSLRKIGF